MVSLYSALRPLIFRASAEGAHDAAISAAKLGARIPWATRAAFGARLSSDDRTRLFREVMGLGFDSPVGVAAGVDKNAELIRMWPNVGAGFCEVGSVSALSSKGNPKPRAFRLPDDRALVNRMGLNNHGAEPIAARIRSTMRPPRFPLGINLVKTHDPSILGAAGVEDFVTSARHLLPLADFCVLNVSCPNTTEGKTFESPEALEPLLDAVMAERARQNSSVPMLVKLSPPPAAHFDAGAVNALVELSLERGITGFVATNTAADRAGLATPSKRLEAIGRGGLSGAPIRERAEALVRHLRQEVRGRTDSPITIIGVGGIDSGEAAYARIRAGADLIELYTGLVYEGPALFGRIAKDLARRLDADGLASIADAVGLDAT